MNIVQPVRDKRKLEAMKTLLREKDEKYYIMFIIGINSGLRVSDILNLKVKDVKDKMHIVIVEKKTGKMKRFLINDKLKKEISNYIENMDDEEFLFTSRIKDKDGNKKHISRIQAYQVLNEVAYQVGVSEVGTHTMRKTFGYWHYKQYHDVALLQEIFNHSAPSITLRYIGITDDEKDESIRNFYL